MNPLHLHIFKYLEPVLLEKVNPWAQRSKENSFPPHLSPSTKEWNADVKSAGCPGGAPRALMSIPKCHGIPHSCHCLIGRRRALQQHRQKLLLLMALSKTPSRYKPCFPWDLSEVRDHIASWQKPTPDSDRLSWPMTCMTKARLVEPSRPCDLSVCWWQECLSCFGHCTGPQGQQPSQITHILNHSGLVLSLSHSN